MLSHRVVIAAALAGALMLPLAANAQSTLGNKSVPGVCMLSRGAILAGSKVGQAADARLKQLAQQAQNQLETERKPLDQDIQQFRQKAQSMSETERASQQKALQERLQAFQQKAQELKARIQLTRSKAMQRIGAAIDPLVANIYKQHDCGILLDRDTVLGGNPQNDLTDAVTQALDKKMTTISFNLAPLPKQSSNASGK
ncbi:MAG TPA: OmpH family outer membrane protein [Oleiagrimonas sp.]|nr:OmpH family outer membrane protein [Oleiagrimonas sp.]